jgi:hypothetical protein
MGLVGYRFDKRDTEKEQRDVLHGDHGFHDESSGSMFPV